MRSMAMGIFMAWSQDEQALQMDWMADCKREKVKQQRICIQPRVLL